jgi:2-octaprenyl-3-methyl-6-methoxy-1,4-benzoquinol hydroxylase
VKRDYDIVICGGGMIGAALATQLAPHGFSIALVEAQAPAAYDLSQRFDLRICALSPKSAQVMQQSKAWDILQGMRLCPYKRMRVWEMAGFGDLTFNASQVGVPELGHIVENRLVQLSLWQALEERDNVDIICPASPESFHRESTTTRIDLDTGQSLSARLVVGADGAQSKVRQGFGVGVNRGQYQQACLVASVNTQLGQQDITWQRFVNTGPQAFLPLLGQHGSVVWYHQADQARALSNLTQEDLADEIMAQFPAQLGKIEVTARATFGLQKQHAQSYCAHGMVLVGDAAHVINPLAGQGVNLGFQDVACLAKVLTDAHKNGENWSAMNVLSRYQRQRKWANSLMLHSMDAFHHGFSQTNTNTKWLRNLALASANLPVIKKRVVRYAMGM